MILENTNGINEMCPCMYIHTFACAYVRKRLTKIQVFKISCQYNYSDFIINGQEICEQIQRSFLPCEYLRPLLLL